MACCGGAREIDQKMGTFQATNSISILAKGYPQQVTKVSSKKTLNVQYTTDMELDVDERKALHELLTAIDSQQRKGCCCCPSDEDHKKIMEKVQEMHMAYQINSSCYHIHQVLLTKTGNVVNAKKSDNNSTEVPHGVMLFPGIPGIITQRILSDEERQEVLHLQALGSKQCLNMSKTEICLICVTSGLYSVGIAVAATAGLLMCMMCCNCRNYKSLKHNFLNSGSQRTVSILEEFCWTVNTVEYRNFSYPVHHFDPTSTVVMTMER